MPKIAITKPLSEAGMAYAAAHAEITVLDTRDPAEVLEKLAADPVDALIARWLPMDAAFMRGFAKTGCKALAKFATGLDACDLEAATECRIPVVYAFGANARSVAEYTVAMMLSMYRDIPKCDRRSHAGSNAYGKGGYLSHEFFGKKLYIVGFGNIGRQVGKMCAALGMRIAAFDKFLPRERVEAEGAEYCARMEDGLPDADIVSIHMPLTEETRGIVNAAFLDRMKPGAYLVNTARGGVIDENEIVRRLNDGRLGGAAFDASSIDDGEVNEALCKCENLVLSAHVAAMTEESLEGMAKLCVDGILSVLNRERWRITANPQVYDLLGF